MELAGNSGVEQTGYEVFEGWIRHSINIPAMRITIKGSLQE